MSVLSADLVRETLAQLRRPRLVCVCGDFKLTTEWELDFCKCGHCGGWMSAERLVEARFGDAKI